MALDDLARVVAAISRFGAAHPEWGEVECNPVAASPDGAVALDARMVPRRSS